MRQRKGRMLNATITDGTHELELTFFSAYGHEDRLVPGALGLFSGVVGRYQRTWQLTHPDYELFPPEREDAAVEEHMGRLKPIYLPAGKPMPSWKVAKVVQIVLASLDELPDHLPPDVRTRRRLVDLMSMYRLLHQPSTEKDELDLTFFSAYGHEDRLVPGALGLFSGVVGRYQRTWQLTHPDYELFPPEREDAAVEEHMGRLKPIYLPAGKPMPSWKVAKVVQIVLASLDELPDHLPPDVRTRRRLVDLMSMYRLLHQPSTEKDFGRCQERGLYA